MKIRSIYQSIVRLHPPVFRARFGEQMLSIFDESAQRRGASRLVFDALLSLLRQWLFRPRNWRRAAHTPPTLDAIHRTSRLWRITWCVNVLWTFAVVVVFAGLQPRRYEADADWSSIMAMVITLVVSVYLSLLADKRRGASRSLEFQSLEIERDPKNPRLVRRRDTLDCMYGITSQSLVLLVFPSAWFLLALLRGILPAEARWRLSVFFAGAVGLFAFFLLVVNKLNDRTIRKIEGEIDAN